MSTYIETLKKPNGVDSIAPRTLTSAITNSTGVPLETLMDGIQKATPITVTINASDWSNKTATKSVTGITSTSNVIVEGEATCTALGNGTMTFAIDTVPTTAITMKVLLFKQAVDGGQPFAVSSAAEMNAILEQAQYSGVVFHYIGETTDTYENGAYYILEVT